MPKREDHLDIFGHRLVPIKWRKGHAISGDTPVHGEARSIPDYVQVSGKSREPISSLLHEAWHVYARAMADDDAEKDDAAARRVETFVVDMVLRNWWVLQLLRQERLELESYGQEE
jgi:hypothetical protein